jgi:ribosome-associated toxin RatA of RatAB toxin-antitoxin module
MTNAVIAVDAPRKQVFAVLRDFGAYSAWLPGCEQSRVVAARGETDEVEITLSAPRRMTMTLRFEAQAQRSLGFEMIKGHGLRAYRGSYRFIDAADQRGTVVMADLDIDAGAFAPSFLVDRLAAKALVDTGEALRRHIQTLTPMPVAPPAPRATPSDRLPGAKRILLIARTRGGYRAWYDGTVLRPETTARGRLAVSRTGTRT